VPASTVKTDKFIEYLKTRSKLSKKLRDYYGNESKKEAQDEADQDVIQDKEVFQDNDEEVQVKSTKEKETQEVVNTEDDSKKQKLLPFRKMKSSSYINRRQADKRLARNLRKLDENAILVFGDWSAPNIKFYEPIQGVGTKRMLKKEGFKVLLINEFKTSSICRTCNSHLKKFKKVVNPRPFRWDSMPQTICHGLLKYFML
jgi:hypothetical protein